MKKIILSILISLLFIVPIGIFAEEEDEEISFNLKEQVINDFKSTDYSVNDNHFIKDGNEVFTLVNDLDNTLVLKVNDNSISNEGAKEMLLDVLANSTQVDGSLSFVCSNDFSYFVFSNDEERVYRISNLNSNHEIKVSLIKNEEYINPEFNVNFDDYTITNGDTFIFSNNDNDKSPIDSENISNQLQEVITNNNIKDDMKEATAIKDSDGKELFSISLNDDGYVIEVEGSNNLSEEEISEYVAMVANTYGISKDEISVVQTNNITSTINSNENINSNADLLPIIEAVGLVLLIIVLVIIIVKSKFKKKK